jgi:hypothetical protein
VRFEIAKDVLFRRLGDDAVLLHLSTERYYSLNDSALRIWELLIAGNDEQQTAKVIADEYDADDETIRADITRLISSLREAGLVVTE